MNLQVDLRLQHEHNVLGVAMSTDGMQLATGCADKNAYEVGLRLHHEHYALGVAMSSDGKLLATGCADKNAYVWDIHTILKDSMTGLENLLSLPDVPHDGHEQKIVRKLLDTDATRRVQQEESHPEPPSSSFLDVSSTRNNDEGKDQQVLPVGAETPPSDDDPTANDNDDNRMMWKSLMRTQGKDTSSKHEEENKGGDNKLRPKEDDGQRNTSTSPHSESTATEKQTCQESADASDSLQDLTDSIQGRSEYPIASGGFGDIWKCVLVRSNETVEVAVKTIRAFDAGNDVLVRKNSKRVRRELKVWDHAKHDCILPLWGVANDFGPYPAMICPWVKNGALTGFLEREQDMLSSQDKFSLLNDIALGLQYLHDKTIVHGDLTGSNVLVHGSGRACLADFGLSTIMEFIGTSYATSTIRGNIRWAAAELFEAQEDDEENEAAVSLSTECDIYSFGSIALQVSHSDFRAKDLVHFAYALGVDVQGTLLQCEEG
ncbi:kinase-like protein [Rhizopogon vinicolor AM-OR11-026]|uniref:Kinase-like protein n=1 Tax=Rhizopogon vinicolor AM-OR11-026 TaxID=1314800 RepID=A0A1B7N0T0_9AGAM|nr:kinase-like protein [Rhizopogon vinicolor AM-OR11-026]